MTKFLGFIATFAFALSAQASFEQYAGTYKGKFEKTNGSLIIEVTGGVLSAQFVADGTMSTDVLASCSSKIGKMLKMDIDDGVEIDHATFSFDPGTCAKSVQGREFIVDFKHKKGKVVGAKAAVFSHSTESSSYICTGPADDKSCDWTTSTDYWYFNGKFARCAWPNCGG